MSRERRPSIADPDRSTPLPRRPTPHRGTWRVLLPALVASALAAHASGVALPAAPDAASRRPHAAPALESNAGTAAELVVPVTADATIDEQMPTTNFGGDYSLELRHVPAGGTVGRQWKHTLLAVDVSAIPTGSTIDDARLELYTTTASGAGLMDVTTCTADAAWTEMGVTWNTQPPISSGTLCTASQIPSSTGAYAALPATDIVQAWVDGSRPNHGLFVRALLSTSAGRTFQSHEPISHGHFPPRLVVVYTAPTAIVTPSPTPTSAATFTRTPSATPTAAVPTSTPTSAASPTPTPALPTDTPTAAPSDTPVILFPPPDPPPSPACAIRRPRAGFEAHLITWAAAPSGATNVHVETLSLGGTWDEIGEAPAEAGGWTRLLDFEDIVPPDPRYRLRSHRHDDGAYSSYVEVPRCTVPLVQPTPSPTPTAAPPSPVVGCPVATCMVIDFETEADGVTPIEPGTVIIDRYQALYPTFSRSVIVAPPAGAHSPPQALQASEGGSTVGFPGPLTVHFARPQSFVSFAVAAGSETGGTAVVRARAYRTGGTEPLAEASTVLAGGGRPMETVLALDRGTRPDLFSGGAVRIRDIGRVEIEFDGAAAEVIDDLTFDVFGPRPAAPPPPCAGVPFPAVDIDPLPGRVSVNSISIAGSVLTEGPPVSAAVVVDGAAPGQHASLPLSPLHLYLTPDRLVSGRYTVNVANLMEALFPGVNSVRVSVHDGCRLGQSAPQTITLVPAYDAPPPACLALPLGPDPAAPVTVAFEGAWAEGTVFEAQFLGAHGFLLPHDEPGHAVEPGGPPLDRHARVRASDGIGHVGPLVIRFHRPQRRVRMTVGLDGTGGPRALVRAYDRPYGGALVSEAVEPVVRDIADPLAGAVEVVGGATSDIYRIEVEAEGNGVEAIDDLVLYRACPPLPPAPETVDVKVAGMEITQVVNQMLVPPVRPPGDAFAHRGRYSGIPLVKGKHTVVRVYGAVDGTGQPVSDIPARLSVYAGSGPDTDRALGVLEPVATFGGARGHRIRLDPGRALDILRADAALSWNFVLPLSWIRDLDPFALPDPGPIHLRLVADINSPPTVAECDRPECGENDRFMVYDVEFRRTAPLQIKPVLVTIDKGTGVERTAPPESAACTFWDGQVGSPLGGIGPSVDLCAAAGITVDRPGFVQRIYPVANGNIRISETVRRIERSDGPDDGGFRDGTIHAMCEKYAGETWLKDLAARARVAGLVVYGLVPRSIDGTEVRGLGLYNQPCSIGPVGDQPTTAHELGHNAKLRHASSAHEEEGCGCVEVSTLRICSFDCEHEWPYPHGGIGEFGFDTLAMRAIDPGSPPGGPHAHDLMSYGGGTAGDSGEWISPRNYCRLLDHLGGGTSEYCDSERRAEVDAGRVAVHMESATRDPLARLGPFGALASRSGLLGLDRRVGGERASERKDAAVESAVESAEYVLVRGRLSEGSAELLPLYAITLPEPPAAAETAELLVELRDGGDRVLGSAGAELEWLEDGDRPSASFTALVPASESAQRLVVLAGDEILVERERGGRAPTIRLDEGTEDWSWESSGVYTVGWRSRGGTADDVVHMVQYSPDEGATWMVLAMDEPAESVDIDAADLPGGERALVRVTASDGFLSASDTTASPFRVASKRPKLSIVATGDGAANEDGAAGLLAIGSDHEDGPLDGATMRWSVDGELVASGTDHLALGDLDPGAHVVVVTARDSDGHSAAAETTVDVAPGRTEGAPPVDPLVVRLEAEPRPMCGPGPLEAVVARWSVEGGAPPLEVRIVMEVLDGGGGGGGGGGAGGGGGGSESEFRTADAAGEHVFPVDSGTESGTAAAVRLFVRGADGAEVAGGAQITMGPCVTAPIYLPATWSTGR